MQVGLGVAVSVFNTPRALRYARAFATCLAWEAENTVQAAGAENLLFQIGAPFEVIMATGCREPQLHSRPGQSST